jgi:CDP-diacylglycerol--glycerol-3-phosphate 3-phosphatidyltransferase
MRGTFLFDTIETLRPSMQETNKGPNNPVLTFLDRFLDVPEAKVTYLTRATAIDRFLAKTFLKLLPNDITPNLITKFRLITIPIIAFLLGFNFYILGTILFLFAAFSDALDGALARTTRKITTWGTFYDPIADKLLIGSVAVIVISKYIGSYMALGIILIELFLVSSAYYRYKGRIVPAKTIGKTKMILQCVGVIVLLFSVVFHMPVLLTVATYILGLAIFFGLLSLFVFRSI